MPAYPLSKLPDHSRLWIFAADKPIDASRIAEFEQRLSGIVGVWQAHGKALAGGCEIRYGQFAFIAADENIEAPSGCSIDSLTHEIAQLGSEFGVNFLSGMRVFYRAGSAIGSVDRVKFRALVEKGEVALDTIVFNNTLTSLSELRAGSWEVPASRSWHAQAFRFPAVA